MVVVVVVGTVVGATAEASDGANSWRDSYKLASWGEIELHVRMIYIGIKYDMNSFVG